MKARNRKLLMICALVAIAIISIRLLFFETTLKYGVILLAGIVLAFLIWKAFIKNSVDELKQAKNREDLLEDQIDALKQTVNSLQRELDEKNNSKINVVGLNPILHVAILNIDSSFTRPYLRQNGKQYFQGALRADISAEYGIKMEEVKFRYDKDSDTLFLRDFNPGLISYSKKQLTWEFANGFKKVNVLGKEFHSFSESYTNEMCEQLRGDLEKEIDERSIEEFDWLSPMISKQVGDMFKMMINHPDATIVVLDEGSEDNTGFIKFSEFKEGALLPAGNQADNQGEQQKQEHEGA